MNEINRVAPATMHFCSMSLQEAYDRIVTTLLQQGGPSIGGLTCLFLNPAGHVCAAGALIPEAVRSSSFNGFGVDHLFRMLEREGVIDLRDIIGLAEAMLDIHDDSRNYDKHVTYVAPCDPPVEYRWSMDQFVPELRRVAGSYLLNTDALDAALAKIAPAATA